MDIAAPAHWRTIDFLSDLHLDEKDGASLHAFLRYLQQTPAQALFILGDLFEVWVGDDCLSRTGGIEPAVAAALSQASKRLSIHIMCGNRDFLMGKALMQACGAQALQDPTVLIAGGHRYLMTHGDALCLSDTDYLAFRKTVRQTTWQQDFLAKPLADRQAIGRQMRMQSEAHKTAARSTGDLQWHDVDNTSSLQMLADFDAQTMIHGHTHHPAVHALGQGKSRWVLSDWDGISRPPRAEVLRLDVRQIQTDSFQRVSVPT
jgi:UDP-2,3-diacylglucosamine hydrolase